MFTDETHLLLLFGSTRPRAWLLGPRTRLSPFCSPRYQILDGHRVVVEGVEGVPDGPVACAAAQVAVQNLLDCLLLGDGLVLEEADMKRREVTPRPIFILRRQQCTRYYLPVHCHDHAGRAESALRSKVIMQPLLHRVESVSGVSQALHRRDLPSGTLKHRGDALMEAD